MRICSIFALFIFPGLLCAQQAPFKIDPNRVIRSPEMVVEQLFNHYGLQFNGSYVQGLAVMVRLREKGAGAIEPIVDGQMAQPAKLKSGSQIAGRLLFAEMGRGGDSVAKALALEAADLGFSKSTGAPLTAMPFHNEMSDAIFMGGPILAHAGVFTGDSKYFDQSMRQVRFVRDLCLREDGLYRHSPLDESAWGRGNGFPAIGLAMILNSLPRDHPDYEFGVNALKAHLLALKPHQDASGMWHQVIDHPESYPEFTCTCMISYAILLGIQNRWLEHSEWDETIQQSWKAVLSRIDLEGRNINGACTGTGKQKSLEAYLKRKEINGFDDRAGSMALLFASEMKRYRQVVASIF